MPDYTTKTAETSRETDGPTREANCPQAAKLSSEGRHIPVADASDSCGLPTPVCPSCEGVKLEIIGREALCGGCERRWPAIERSPCPDRPLIVVRCRGMEHEFYLCASHAARMVAEKPRDVFIHGVRKCHAH